MDWSMDGCNPNLLLGSPDKTKKGLGCLLKFSASADLKESGPTHYGNISKLLISVNKSQYMWLKQSLTCGILSFGHISCTSP